MEKPSEPRKPRLHLRSLARPSTGTARKGVAVRIALGRLAGLLLLLGRCTDRSGVYSMLMFLMASLANRFD